MSDTCGYCGDPLNPNQEQAHPECLEQADRDEYEDALRTLAAFELDCSTGTGHIWIIDDHGLAPGNVKYCDRCGIAAPPP
jgi:hypothetical protein